jgi:hypothetical protein
MGMVMAEGMEKESGILSQLEQQEQQEHHHYHHYPHCHLLILLRLSAAYSKPL